MTDTNFYQTSIHHINLEERSAYTRDFSNKMFEVLLIEAQAKLNAVSGQAKVAPEMPKSKPAVVEPEAPKSNSVKKEPTEPAIVDPSDINNSDIACRRTFTKSVTDKPKFFSYWQRYAKNDPRLAKILKFDLDNAIAGAIAAKNDQGTLYRIAEDLRLKWTLPLCKVYGANFIATDYAEKWDELHGYLLRAGKVSTKNTIAYHTAHKTKFKGFKDYVQPGSLNKLLWMVDCRLGMDFGDLQTRWFKTDIDFWIGIPNYKELMLESDLTYKSFPICNRPGGKEQFEFLEKLATDYFDKYGK